MSDTASKPEQRIRAIHEQRMKARGFWSDGSYDRGHADRVAQRVVAALRGDENRPWMHSHAWEEVGACVECDAASILNALGDDERRALRPPGERPMTEPTDNVIRIYAHDPKLGERVWRPARCVDRYVARIGWVEGCGWDGYLVRTIGEDKIPPCPRCGSWTEAVVAPRSVMRRFQHDEWPR